MPSAPGRLVVATDLPAIGFWDGADPAAVHGGFEWGIADALASQLDLQLEVRQVPFGDIVRGALGGADIALSQVSVTDANGTVVNANTVRLSLDLFEAAEQDETILIASDTNGIVSADDGEMWMGVMDLELPFP